MKELMIRLYDLVQSNIHINAHCLHINAHCLDRAFVTDLSIIFFLLMSGCGVIINNVTDF